MRWIVCAWALTLLLTGCGQETTPDTHTPTDTTTTTTTAGTTVTTTAEVTTEKLTTTAEKTTEKTLVSTALVTTSTTKAPSSTQKTTSTTKRPTTTTTTTTAAKTTPTTSATTAVQSSTTTSTTTSAKPTVLSSTGHSIAVNKDDPWKYPLDVDACIADCKAYGESLGLTWDESLALDNASWSGEICTYQTAIAPERWDDRAEVMGAIDRFLREGSRRFRILFIPCHQTGVYGTIDGIYDIYAVSL